ncbi:MAG: hypothetical protein U0441_22660 [Polyangiaceae bacterium]
MSHRLKVTINNESPYTLFVADNAEETVLKAPSVLATGSNSLPTFIPAFQENPPDPPPPHAADFTIATPISGPTPEGSIVVELDTLRLRAHLSWKDFIANGATNPSSSPPNPCSCTEERLDGGIGNLNATIEYLDEKGNLVELSTLADKEVQDARAQQDAMAKTMKDPRHPVQVVMIPLEVRFTLKVAVPATIGTAPSTQKGTAPATSVRPTGSSKVIFGSRYPRWNSFDLPRRRQKLLAAIGNTFPMVWDQQTGDIEAKSGLPYQDMKCWKAKEGTSCTNVAGFLEELLTGSKGKWGFSAHFFEEAWVPWGANPAKPMPNVGDIYLLYSDLERPKGKKMEDPQLRHVGFILHVPKDESEHWVTADGGQNGKPGDGYYGGGAFLNLKKWETRLPTKTPKLNRSVWDKQMKAHLFAAPIADKPYPYLAGGAESDSLEDANRLIGWLDIDALTTPFLSDDFDDYLTPGLLSNPNLTCQQKNRHSQARAITKADFCFLGAWIDEMLGKSSDFLQWRSHIKDPTLNPPPGDPRLDSPFCRTLGDLTPSI